MAERRAAYDAKKLMERLRERDREDQTRASEPEAVKEPDPPDPEPQPEPARKAGPTTSMTAFRLPTDLAEELRGAAKVLDADQALIVREALERELARLRAKYNDKQPFPRVPSGKGRRRL